MKKLCILSLLSVFLALPAFAQTNSGRESYVVKDSTVGAIFTASLAPTPTVTVEIPLTPDEKDVLAAANKIVEAADAAADQAHRDYAAIEEEVLQSHSGGDDTTGWNITEDNQQIEYTLPLQISTNATLVYISQ